ncbi:hypothetical protein COCVIDRAFT_105112 [Bipolaris victoriae FI3]|uniref:Uncharacterized protein n=2 Tax=Bipolaris TaxID=33194 RepID=W6XVC9_COCC2|nr:uncharacterized protein COCCADRAFT_105963 [Bipolaris zeicola 26-R-13]XP_014554394.1 hypothetical protein COCVIDRAFT_105112 [Bipolaris victoriae FI3]EUC29668.1 hypothetical protein COCCADRAFT_105963 [Bipolaris zeicola 26-R-13]
MVATVTAQARLLGSVSAIVSLRGTWECMEQQKNLDSNGYLQAYSCVYRSTR